MMVLGLNLFIYDVFYEFYLMFKDFINICEYAIEIIYISDHGKKGMRLSFNVVLYLVL